MCVVNRKKQGKIFSLDGKITRVIWCNEMFVGDRMKEKKKPPFTLFLRFFRSPSSSFFFILHFLNLIFFFRGDDFMLFGEKRKFTFNQHMRS